MVGHQTETERRGWIARHSRGDVGTDTEDPCLPLALWVPVSSVVVWTMHWQGREKAIKKYSVAVSRSRRVKVLSLLSVVLHLNSLLKLIYVPFLPARV